MRDWRADAKFHQKKNSERERDKRTRGGQRTPGSELAFGRLWLIINIELTI
jgi:hypothetical protein